MYVGVVGDAEQCANAHTVRMGRTGRGKGFGNRSTAGNTKALSAAVRFKIMTIGTDTDSLTLPIAANCPLRHEDRQRSVR
jgi:hypothetical protein